MIIVLLLILGGAYLMTGMWLLRFKSNLGKTETGKFLLSDDMLDYVITAPIPVTLSLAWPVIFLIEYTVKEAKRFNNRKGN